MNINQNVNQSVINTDKFDRRRFQKLYSMSKGLQDLNNFENPFPTFGSLLSDIWASMYKMDPRLTDQNIIGQELQTNYSFMNRIMNDEQFKDYRDYTRLDDFASAISTVNFGKKTHEWLQQQRKHNKELDQRLQDVQRMQKQAEQQKRDQGPNNVNKTLQNDLQQATNRLQEVVDEALNNNNASFQQAIHRAIQETKNTKESVKALMGGTKAGSGEAELKKIPLRDQLKLADKISDNHKMKDVAEWAGRFKQIARKKQKSKYNKTISRSGVTLGNDVDRLLPSELMLYKNEATKSDFLRRFSQKGVHQFDSRGRESLGKGPIILCLDQSGSMNKLDSQSKGFALALMGIAKKQRRDFALIPFSTKAFIYLYKKGKISASDMLGLCERFIGGGTNFEIALEKATEVIGDSSFKRADIVFVTDGESNVSNRFLSSFEKQKQVKEFNVLSLLIGAHSDKVDKFSDRVIQINDFTDQGSFTAFEI